VLWLAAACEDNVGCVFVNGCSGDPPLPPNEALRPVTGEWISSAVPEVVASFPTGTGHPGTTPVVLVFSETIQIQSVAGAFELVREGSVQPVPAAQALVSEGRVLVMLPSTTTPLGAGTYVVLLAEDAVVVDLGGQQLDLEAGAEVGRFTVVSDPVEEPQLVTTFPEDGAADQGESLELLAVFDRPLDGATVTPLAFDVRVDGANPVPDPLAQPLRVGTAPGVPDARVLVYQRLDPDGLPLPFGRSATVELRLSPAGSELADADGDELEATTVSFETLAFAAPLGGSLLSDPFDAIGLANLTDGNPEELMLEVELDMAEPNDSLDLYLFGLQRRDDENPPLIALLRTKRLTGTAPIQSTIFTREEINLQLSAAPADVRFEDGPLTFAFALRRGSASSPLVVLDLDDAPETILDPELDITAPVLASWAGLGGTSEFRSELRDLSLAGQANERVRGVEVSTQLGGNGSMPPVVGADEDGFFLAAPVPLGRLDGGAATFSAVLRDRAQNPTAALSGEYLQRGALGPGAFTPGQTLEILVYAGDTLEVIQGARVLVHSDLGNGVDYPFFVATNTGLDGRAMVATPGNPAVGAILTVVQPGFDLFTLHGVPVTRLSVPLEPSGQTPALATGRAATSDSGALAIAGLDRRFDDSRRGASAPRGFRGMACSLANDTLLCDYEGAPFPPRELGARSFFAGDFAQTEAGFSAADVLQAFALTLPLPPANPGAEQEAELEVSGLLAAGPVGDAAQAVPPFRFRLPAASGLVPPFEDDLETSGILFAGLETLVPGLPSAIAVGPAVSFELAADLWTVLGAYPGAIAPAGSLGSAGSVDTDPFVRVELVDTLGSACGVRQRVSTLAAGGPLPEFLALQAPLPTAPAPGAATGGQAFDLRFVHAIGDARSEGGLYRVTLVDAAQRRWILWRFDPAGSADVAVRVVDVGDGGLVGLADGVLSATVVAFAWNGFDATDLLWSDVERRFELFARAAPLQFQKP